MAELPLSALEYAWGRDDDGFALWMVVSSLERNAIALESLRPADVLGSVTGDGNGDAPRESRVDEARRSDDAAAHRSL